MQSYSGSTQLTTSNVNIAGNYYTNINKFVDTTFQITFYNLQVKFKMHIYKFKEVLFKRKHN